MAKLDVCNTPPPPDQNDRRWVKSLDLKTFREPCYYLDEYKADGRKLIYQPETSIDATRFNLLRRLLGGNCAPNVWLRSIDVWMFCCYRGDDERVYRLDLWRLPPRVLNAVVEQFAPQPAPYVVMEPAKAEKLRAFAPAFAPAPLPKGATANGQAYWEIVKAIAWDWLESENLDEILISHALLNLKTATLEYSDPILADGTNLFTKEKLAQRTAAKLSKGEKRIIDKYRQAVRFREVNYLKATTLR